MKVLSPLLIFVLLMANTAFASQQASSQHELLKDATTVLEDILSTPDVQIPAGLISKAKAIIVFPSMVKVGFIGAVRYGKGVATVRDPKTGLWGPPSFVTTVGGSVGFQVGAEAVDLVLLIMTEKGMKGLLKNNFTLGTDLAVTAGPVGRHAEFGLDIQLQGDAYSYSRSKGLFAGVSLKGTVIKPNLKYNKEYYRQNLTAQEIMMQGGLRNIPESSRRFMRDFNRLAPPPPSEELKTLARLNEGERKPETAPTPRTRPQPSSKPKQPEPLW